MSSEAKMRLETPSENIARSIREGVFPKQLDPIMVPDFSKEKQLSDLISRHLHHGRMEGLQFTKSEWLVIVNALSHFAMQEYGDPEEPSLKFGRALSALPDLAVAAGCHVGIKVTPLPQPTSGGDGCFCTHHPDDPAHGPACYIAPTGGRMDE